MSTTYDNTVSTAFSEENFNNWAASVLNPPPMSKEKMEELRRDAETRIAIGKELHELIEAGKITMKQGLLIGAHLKCVESMSCAGVAYGIWRDYVEKKFPTSPTTK